MNVTCTSYVIPSDYRGIKVFLRQVERIAFALGIARSEKALATTSSRRRLELRLRSNSHANDFSRKRLRAPPQFQPKEQTQNSRSKEMGCAVSSMRMATNICSLVCGGPLHSIRLNYCDYPSDSEDIEAE